jgi:hypothetical protein
MISRQVKKYATVSPCGLYRYTLSRVWDEDKPGVLFIMLNPSTADASEDDPTIRRCIGFGKAWGCGSITVVNLFAYRATDPALLASCVSIAPTTAVGPLNDAHIQRNLKAHGERGDYIVAAWGARGNDRVFQGRRDTVICFLPLADLMCLDTTKTGEPKHPLYCRADMTPCKWEIRSRKREDRMFTRPDGQKEGRAMKPLVGDTVHYVGKDADLILPTGFHCAAVVKSVREDMRGKVNLNVLHPVAGSEDVFEVTEDTTGTPGTWHRIERE